MPDVFLSYSRDDLNTARRFAEAFEREGFSVWWDQTLNPGEAFDEVTEKALQEARAVVVLWSKKSVASRWVRAEATQANDSKTLVPVMIEACKRPIMFELTHTADLSNWKGNSDDAAWQSYLAGVKRVVGMKAGHSRSPAVVSPRPNQGRFGARLLVGAVALVAIAAAAIWLTSRAPGVAPRSVEALAASPAATKAVTLAVLPFVNVSTDPQQEPFCDGLTEEFLNQLGHIEGLTVTGRMSSFSFKGKNVDPRTIAQTLGVAYLLTGSIRKEGDQLRISAQLINGKDGTQLWSKTYDRERKEVFAVQEEVAKDVTRALQVKLSVGDEAALPGSTHDVDAFEAATAANSLAQKYTAEGTRRAIEQYQRAVAIDPKYASAWARLSSLYRTSARAFLIDEPAKTWLDRSNAALEEAARLAPEAFYVQDLLGSRSVDRNEWIEAGNHFRMAAASFSRQTSSLHADPYDGINPEFLLYVGRFKDHIERMERYRIADPLNSGISMFLGAAYADSGSFPEAFAEFERGERLEGAQGFIRGGGLFAALATRDRPQINRWLNSYISLGPSLVAADDIAVAMKPLLDKPAQALAYLRSRAGVSTNENELNAVAAWMAYFGDANGALAVLRTETMRKASAGILPVTFWGPVMRDVRKLPGFKQLVRDVGLVDYWREFGWPDLCKPVGKDDFECH